MLTKPVVLTWLVLLVVVLGTGGPFGGTALAAVVTAAAATWCAYRDDRPVRTG